MTKENGRKKSQGRKGLAWLWEEMARVLSATQGGQEVQAIVTRGRKAGRLERADMLGWLAGKREKRKSWVRVEGKERPFGEGRRVDPGNDEGEGRRGRKEKKSEEESRA